MTDDQNEDNRATMPETENRLSLSAPMPMRSEALARIKWYAAEIVTLGSAVEAVDMALMTLQTDCSSSEQQALAVRHGDDAATNLRGPLVQ